MKMIDRIILVFFLLVLLSSHTNGQKRDYKFTRINVQDEGSIGQVNFIAEDKSGFIWFSEETGSLIRYDGDNIKRYQNDPHNPNSLGGTYPECLLIDKDGIIWIGFFGTGVDKFDPTTEIFTHFRYDPTNQNSIRNDTVSAIIQDSMGNILIGTMGGLSIVDPMSGRFTNYRYNPNDSTSISSNSVRKIYEDKQGNVWIGTGWYNNSSDLGGLNRFDKSTGTFKRHMVRSGDPTALQNKRITSIYEDSRQNFWIGTNENGLYILNRGTDEFKRLSYDPGSQNKLQSITELGSEGYGISFIEEDFERNLWIGLATAGFYVFNPFENTLSRFGNNYDAYGTFIEGTSWCIHKGSNGLLWISTQPGLYQVDPFSFFISRIDNGLPPYAKESDSIYWSGFSNGLIRVSAYDSLLFTRSFDLIKNKPIPLETITTLLIDQERILWIGTIKGLHYLDLKQNSPAIYQVKSKDLNLEEITALYEDDEGTIWIGTYSGKALIRYDKQRGEFEYDVKRSDGFPFRISDIEGGIKNELWIGLGLGGSIVRLNTKTKEQEYYGLGNNVNQILKDHDGIIWVSAPSGLYRYDRDKNMFMTVSNYSTYGILEDNHYNLWVSSFSDVYRLISSKDGLIRYPGEYVGREGPMSSYGSGGYMLNDGTIYIGDERDYYIFNSDKTPAAPDTSRLYFTRLWIGEDLITSNIDKTNDVHFINQEGITLKSEQNTFSLSFTDIDYRNPGRNKISYLLEGYDLDWRQSYSEEKITYFNVTPGHYDFQIKAINSVTGQWAFRSLSVDILPPWWRTWWAYLIYTLIFVGGVILVDRIQRTRLIRKEREKARQKELEQAHKIEKAYKELKTTQNQLIQSEKMASLGELMAGIAHEIQNPLNFVNNFSEVNSELIAEQKEELEKGNVKEASEIANEIGENEKKIIHHGKRADGIVKSMLLHSQKSSGQKELTDINALCDEYLRLAFHGLRAKDKSFNAEFKTDLDPDLPKINVVPQDIGRVLLNLINNAFYAVNKKSKDNQGDYKPVVEVSTKLSPSGGGKGEEIIEITVRDNGSGIPEEIKDKIFQPFFTTKPTGQGTGLGLSLAYDIITKIHYGSLSMKSTVGAGSVFIIQLKTSN